MLLYVIVQKRDDQLSVCGKEHKIYSNYEDALKDFKPIFEEWGRHAVLELDYPISKILQWMKYPPMIMEVSEPKFIFDDSNIESKLVKCKELYENYNEKQQEGLRIAIREREEYINKFNSLLLNESD